MSLQAQKALGKNMSLQRQLDGKYMEYKKTLRSSRRRMDSLEEECILSLYKLLLEAKTNKKAGETDQKRTITPDVTLGRSKSAPIRPNSVVTRSGKGKVDVQERPFTSMSSRNYTQSYSFRKDGLDISKYVKRGRANEEKKAEGANRAKSAINLKRENMNGNNKTNWTPDERQQHLQQLRAQSAQPYKGGNDASHPPQTPLIAFHKPEDQTSTVDEPDGITRPVSILKHRKGTPVQVTVHESSTQLDEFRPLSVKISHTSPVQHPIYRQATPSPVHQSRMDTPFEDELLPFVDEADNAKIERLMGDDGDKVNGDRNNRNVITPYPRSMAPSRTDSEEFELMKARSIQNHQKFLADYSKRSKLFGYVVKTKSSIISNEKVRKSGRSPCVTYQELVSIKSSMRQQETRTRMLLKRSAKISKYVDQLAMASDYRKHLQTLKSERLSDLAKEERV